VSMDDPTKNLGYSESMKTIHESMQRALDPMYDINKSLSSMTLASGIANAIAPMKAFNERIETLSKPYGEFEKIIGSILDPMKSWNEQRETLLNPYKGFDTVSSRWEELTKSSALLDVMKPASTYWEEFTKSSALLDVMKPASTYWEEFTKSSALLDVMKPTSSHWEELTKSFRFLQDNLNFKELSSFQKQSELFSSSMSSYNAIGAAISAGYFENIVPKNINSIISGILDKEDKYQKIMESFSTVEEDDETAFLEELQVMHGEILAAVNSQALKMEEQLGIIHARIAALKNPLLLILFLYIVLPLLLNAFYDIAIKPMMNMIDSPRHQQSIIKKEVIRTTKSFFKDTKLRANYRIVTVNVLNVRKSKSKASKTIAFTFFGEVVEIVRKERNWCLIRRYDQESETYIQGWVLTRYLAQIR